MRINLTFYLICRQHIEFHRGLHIPMEAKNYVSDRFITLKYMLHPIVGSAVGGL